MAGKHTSFERSRAALASAALVLACALGACAADAGVGEVRLLPIADDEVRVDETLVLSLTLDNPSGASIDWSYEAPSVRGVERVATLAGTPAGAQFRWTPLASQVGVHELVFTAAWSGGRVEQSTRVTVRPHASSAPVFVRPGTGGAYDLARDPCVEVDVEVSDDDSTAVAIALSSGAPGGATLLSTGPKSALATWCPSPDQVSASLRWTIGLQADDGDHPAVRHDYIVVLQTPPKEGCAGEPPVVTVRSPAAGARVASTAGYEVVVDVSDDQGLRDAPLLYWTTDSPAGDDLSEYRQLEFVSGDRTWRARIPPLGVPEGAAWPVTIVVVATDNDDPSGTACDHVTRTAPLRFEALAGVDTGVIADCSVCSASSECASGMCVVSSGRSHCAAACASCPGACDTATTRAGAIVEVCAGVCGTTEGCSDDANEPDDDASTATPLDASGSGVICESGDFWAIVAGSAGRLDVELRFSHAAGDLDLRLRSSEGATLASSAGLGDTELVSVCVEAGRTYFAEVFGYAGATGQYALGASLEPGACSDCDPDAYEPNDTAASAARLREGLALAGLCEADVDFYAIEVAARGVLVVEAEFDGAEVDLDLEVWNDAGSVVASSTSTGDRERVELDVVPGTYRVRVFPYGEGAGEYTLRWSATVAATCTGSRQCAPPTVCEAGLCASVPCRDARDCPSGHACPLVGPGDPQRGCAPACSADAECRSGERCKRFPGGSACAPAGRGATGDECDDPGDCAAARACLDLPYGYCAVSDCAAGSPCPTGDVCATLGSGTACLRDCAFGDFVCRWDHSCTASTSPAGAPLWVCLP